MDEKNSLIVKEKNLPQNLKNGIKRISKAVGFGALAVGSTGIGLIGITTIPIIVIPAAIGTVYGVHKFTNETIYKSHKDVTFVTSSSIRGNCKISQDAFRLDITSKTKGMSLREKTAFLQLQELVGVSKLNKLDKKGYIITYETVSHGAIRSTLKKLEQMGIITDYSEEYKKKSRLISAKLAMGNIDSLKNKEDMYDIKFKLGEKRIDFDDPEFRKNFKLIFSEKSGLLTKRNWDVVLQEDGTHSIDYNAAEPFMSKIKRKFLRNSTSLSNSLKQESQSLIEQRHFVKKYLGMNEKESINPNIEKKDDKYK